MRDTYKQQLEREVLAAMGAGLAALRLVEYPWKNKGLNETVADRGVDAGLVSRLQHPYAGDGALGPQNTVH